jgi:hypothetical protein
VRVGSEDGLRVISEPRGHDMERHRRIGRQSQRGGRVAQDVQRADRQARGAAVTAEHLREALRVHRAAELVAEQQVVILIRGAGEITLEQLCRAVAPQDVALIAAARQRSDSACDGWQQRHNVRRCFDSFWDHVDEVVLCDTGSTDGTIAEARRFAKEHGEADKLTVGRFEWRDDFSAARTHAHSLATGSVHTYVDLDDVIIGAEHLREEALRFAANPSLGEINAPYLARGSCSCTTRAAACATTRRCAAAVWRPSGM